MIVRIMIVLIMTGSISAKIAARIDWRPDTGRLNGIPVKKGVTGGKAMVADSQRDGPGLNTMGADRRRPAKCLPADHC